MKRITFPPAYMKFFTVLSLAVLLCVGCTESLPDGMSGDPNSGGGCILCHGSTSNAAPPKSTSGEELTSHISVGAHQSHLVTGSLRGAISCDSCHIVPATTDSAGHNNGGNAEITWGGLSGHQGMAPVWNRSTETCSSTYCHGSSLSGGSNTTPVWTTVNGTEASCVTCHGNPPPSPHSSSSNCYSCHPATVTAGNAINVSGGAHIDGQLQTSGNVHPPDWEDNDQHGYSFFDDPGSCKTCHGTDYNGGTSGYSCDQCHTPSSPQAWRTECTFCHGGQDNQSGAPPFGSRGETSVSSGRVGVHTTHVSSGDSHNGYECSTCHLTPASFDSSGHIEGNAGGDVSFNALSGNNAGYTQSTTTCSTLYCHGNGRSDSGSLSWTSSQAMDCDSCHAYYSNSENLSGDHRKHIREGYDCRTCHRDVISSSNVITDKDLHINGTPDVLMQNGTYSNGRCSNLSCHGSENW